MLRHSILTSGNIWTNIEGENISVQIKTDLESLEPTNEFKHISFSLEGNLPSHISIDEKGLIQGTIEPFVFQPLLDIDIQTVDYSGSNFMDIISFEQFVYDFKVIWNYEIFENGEWTPITTSSNITITERRNEDLLAFMFIWGWTKTRISFSKSDSNGRRTVNKHIFTKDNIVYNHLNFKDYCSNVLHMDISKLENIDFNSMLTNTDIDLTKEKFIKLEEKFYEFMKNCPVEFKFNYNKIYLYTDDTVGFILTCDKADELVDYCSRFENYITAEIDFDNVKMILSLNVL